MFIGFKAIQRLYGRKNKTTTQRPNTVDELCQNQKIDVIFETTNREIFVFVGNQCYNITRGKIAEGYPKPISEGWPGLPGNFIFDLYFSSILFINIYLWIGRKY